MSNWRSASYTGGPGLKGAPPTRSEVEAEDAEPVASASGDGPDDEDDDGSYVVVELGPKYQDSIFHEFDDGHPGGEALVVKGRRVRVRYTQRVREAVARQFLVMSKKPATPRPPDMSEMLEDGQMAARSSAMVEQARRQQLRDAAQNVTGFTAPPPPLVAPDARSDGDEPPKSTRGCRPGHEE